MPSRVKGELDLVGYHGETLAIVDVRTRRALKGQPALPEMSITQEKHEVLVRTARYFLRERHIQNRPLRFDVVAIENTPGQPPVVRLHKAALSPNLPRGATSKRIEFRLSLPLRPRKSTIEYRYGCA